MPWRQIVPPLTTDRPTTDLTLHSAGPIGDQHVPILRIVAVAELTDEQTATMNPSTLRAHYQREGRSLAEAIVQHLPGGTVDQLLVALLEHRASLLRVRL